MKNKVEVYKTNNYYGKIILPLENDIFHVGDQQDILVRCDPASISSIVGTAECFPEAALSGIFDTHCCDLSGDWYHSLIHDTATLTPYYVDLLVRGGWDTRKKPQKPVMKLDPFVFNLTNEGEISACRHVNCDGRYTPSADYACMRDSLEPMVPYEANDSSLSGLLSPIWAGIRLIQGKKPNP